MRTIKMTAKRAGECTSCGKAIEIGQSIYWARGAGARHVNCQLAYLTADQCTSCKGSGCRWNNSPCMQCDGTGTRKIQELAETGGSMAAPMPDVTDVAYEDDCARRCGL